MYTYKYFYKISWKIYIVYLGLGVEKTNERNLRIYWRYKINLIFN